MSLALQRFPAHPVIMLDELIKVAIKRGDVTIEEQTIKGIETKEFDL